MKALQNLTLPNRTESTNIVIPFGAEFLVLTAEQFEAARELGRTLAPVASPCQETTSRDEILDADGMERRTGIPDTWWLEQARQKAIPHIRAGKYVRFNLTEALAAVRREPMYTDKRSVRARKSIAE
jgi:hypothetical protein